ncbi:hypothetical protein KIN20_009118 [Parelaphostrongylus tenuis]|uniref:Uncharacterized protein n=1 Tax=Parelaphostrongylus tenuis TaxID=148309 RepID=A0AAD5M7S2_PARTN|nr:hypothetical protein KIN20_009118 [Parelaphostrongylus tenuis]
MLAFKIFLVQNFIRISLATDKEYERLEQDAHEYELEYSDQVSGCTQKKTKQGLNSNGTQ